MVEYCFALSAPRNIQEDRAAVSPLGISNSFLGEGEALMASSEKNGDFAVRRILEILEKEYKPLRPRARIDAYRYNLACVNVRVVDDEFAGKDIADRAEPIWVLFRKHLPSEVRRDIGLLVCFTPEEIETSLVNRDFEEGMPKTRNAARNGRLAEKRQAKPRRQSSSKSG
jgi:hypothetical protein